MTAKLPVTWPSTFRLDSVSTGFVSFFRFADSPPCQVVFSQGGPSYAEFAKQALSHRAFLWLTVYLGAVYVRPPTKPSAEICKLL